LHARAAECKGEADKRDTASRSQIAALEGRVTALALELETQHRTDSIYHGVLRALATDVDIKTEATRRLARHLFVANPTSTEAKTAMREAIFAEDVADLGELDRAAVPLINKDAQQMASLAFTRWAESARLVTKVIRGKRQDAAYMCWACHETPKTVLVRVLNCGHYLCTTCLVPTKAMSDGGKCCTAHDDPCLATWLLFERPRQEDIMIVLPGVIQDPRRLWRWRRRHCATVHA
jgi:hypothetical protein